MAAPNRSSSLPAEKRKAKAAESATGTKSSLLSAEFVDDSDESGDANISIVKKPVSKTAKPDPKSVKPAAPKDSISHAKSSKKRKAPSPSLAEDDTSGSGSEDDGSSKYEERPTRNRLVEVQDASPTTEPKSAPVRPVPPKRSIKPSTGVKPMAQKNDFRAEAASNKSKKEAVVSSEDSSSGSESGNGSDSESGSSDNTSLQSSRKKSSLQKSAPQQPIPIYEPPAGFESTSISVHPASKLSEVFAPSNLQGKQIWHITTPESVPISLVKEVSTQNIGNGASVLEYHGAKYELIPESEAEQASSRALLLPYTQTNNYQPSKTTIIKTLHLQQLVSLPNLALEQAVHPNRSASASESYRKTPRQQPEGLRMRYRPFGVSDNSDLESSPDPMPKAPEFRIPAPVKESSLARKRKRPESNDGSSNIGSAVKSKKRKQGLQATAGAVENPMDVDATPVHRSIGAESPTKMAHPEINGIRSNGNLANGKETKEERKSRKRNGKLDQPKSPPKPTTALPLDVKQDTETMQTGEVVESIASIANPANGTTSTIDISPHKKSKEDKEERRRRKETERAGRGASADDVSRREVVDSQDQMMQEIETAQRAASIPIPAPRDTSPATRPRSELQSQKNSGHVSQRKESKEERKERKEEKKRRRRMGSGSA